MNFRLILPLALVALTPHLSHAATRTVSSTANSGAGTLRQTLADAASGDTILFATSGDITLTTAELVINKTLKIQGPGATSLAIQRSTDEGTPNFRIFRIGANINVSISGLTIRNGNAAADAGGGIVTRGNLTLTSCTLSGNRADNGAGMFANPPAPAVTTLRGCTFSGNTAVFAGGALYNLDNNTLLDNCTLGGNMAGESGGGIHNFQGSVTLQNSRVNGNMAGDGGGIFSNTHLAGRTTTIRASTLNGNEADGSGGGLYNLDGTTVIEGSTLSNNTAAESGGGVHSFQAALTVENSTLSGNSAPDGGGIFSNTDLADLTTTIRASTFGDNSATASGGGLYNFDGATVIERSTFAANQAATGGGLYNYQGILTVENSTLSGNTGSSAGGGLYNNQGMTTVGSSTLTANAAPSNQGSGAASFGDDFTDTRVRNTIIAGNVRSDVDFVGQVANSFQSQGHNLIGSGKATGEFDQSGDKRNVSNPLLGPLADNGGPTQTHALLSGSPAIDAGDATAPATDQRVYGRNGVADIGAFEFNGLPPRPHNDSLSPNGVVSDPVGKARTFTATYSDPNGYRDIRYAYLQVKAGSKGVLRVAYDLPNNKLYILGDNGKYQGGVKPGTNVILRSSTGAIACKYTKARALDATTMQVDWVIAGSAPLIGTQPVLLYVTDKGGLSDGFDQGATWTITSAP